MGHVINHEDLTTRPWICTQCGCKCLSKNPWRRNTHGEGPGGTLEAMYMNVLRNRSTATLQAAKPARPKETAYMTWTDRAEFCYVAREKDIVLYIDPGNDNVSDTGKPMETPAEALLNFFKLIRETSMEVLQGYACAELGGGHKWTDDPALLKGEAHEG